MLQEQQQELLTISFQRWATAKLLISATELAMSTAWVCWLSAERKNRMVYCACVCVRTEEVNREAELYGTCLVLALYKLPAVSFWATHLSCGDRICPVPTELFLHLSHCWGLYNIEEFIHTGVFFTPVLNIQGHGSWRTFLYMNLKAVAKWHVSFLSGPNKGIGLPLPKLI